MEFLLGGLDRYAILEGLENLGRRIVSGEMDNEREPCGEGCRQTWRIFLSGVWQTPEMEEERKRTRN